MNGDSDILSCKCSFDNEYKKGAPDYFNFHLLHSNIHNFTVNNLKPSNLAGKHKWDCFPPAAQLL